MEMDEITELLRDYHSCLTDEHAAIAALNEARAATECERGRVLIEAYQSGAIDGKNEAMRKLQEAAVIENSNSVYWLAQYESTLARSADLAEIDRKQIEAEISLTKAWLYSQSGRVA